jgi:hypothetical protein
VIFYHLTDLGIFGESGLTPGTRLVPPLFPDIHTRDGDFTPYGFPPWVWLTTDAETIPDENGCTLVCLTIDLPWDSRLKSAKEFFDKMPTKDPEMMARAKRTFWTYEGIIHPSCYKAVNVVPGGRLRPWWAIVAA